jgi:hypothetical protein
MCIQAYVHSEEQQGEFWATMQRDSKAEGEKSTIIRKIWNYT